MSDQLRKTLKQARWINALDEYSTWGGSNAGFIAPATDQIVGVLEFDGELLEIAPLNRLDLDELIDWAIDQGYFDDKFARWQSEGSFLEEEEETWSEIVTGIEGTAAAEASRIEGMIHPWEELFTDTEK
jgi:hypothetical protein